MYCKQGPTCIYMCLFSCVPTCTLPYVMQLYIKVLDESKENLKPEPQQVGERGGNSWTFEEATSGPQTNAMELLNPHLPALSQYWLAALKDHAYLSLPAHYSSQLPSGSFYSVDVIESVRPYFRANWPSLLHAASLWLETEGFREKGSSPETQVPVFPGLATKASDPKCNHLRLVLGLAVQALCSPATLDFPSTISHCLSALRHLMRSEYAQEEIGNDLKLTLELMKLFHRLLLTCQSKAIQLCVLDIALLLAGFLKEKKKERVSSPPVVVGIEEAAPSPLTMTSSVGVGMERPAMPPQVGIEAAEQRSATVPVGLEESIVPGASFAFALLEVSACCMFQLLPALSPNDSEGQQRGRHKSSTQTATSAEDAELLSRSVSLLATSTCFCAPESCLEILPPVLHMILSALSTCACSSPTTSCKGSLETSQASPDPSAVLVSACLQSLQFLCSTLPLSSEGSGKKILSLLRSAIFSLLCMDGKRCLYKMSDELCFMAVAVLLRVPEIVHPPSSQLFVSCVDLFRKCLESGSGKVSQLNVYLTISLFLTALHFFDVCSKADTSKSNGTNPREIGISLM